MFRNVSILDSRISLVLTHILAHPHMCTIYNECHFSLGSANFQFGLNGLYVRILACHCTCSLSAIWSLHPDEDDNGNDDSSSVFGVIIFGVIIFGVIIITPKGD